MLLKQKDAYPYEYMNSFKEFSEEKLTQKMFLQVLVIMVKKMVT